jgi:catecholate siderophore receptor
MTTPGTLRLLPTLGWLALLSAATLVVAQTAPNPPSDTLEPAVELSPFVVQVEEDVGYRAASTLAGTRLRMPLSDVGAAITAVTKEFLTDTGVTNLNDLMLYTVSTEGSGLGGNFSGAELAGGFMLEDAARRRPQSGTRVRGLIAADTTRDLFQTDIPFDSYNVDRVDISRGANAILFGLGSPSGVVDNSLIRPQFARSRTNLALRIGDHGSYRGSLDHNQVLLKDRAAIRVAMLHDNTEYRQRPAFQEDERFFVTARGRLFETPSASTMLSAHYERGKIEARRPLLTAPQDRMKSWFLAGQPAWNASVTPTAQGGIPRFPPVGQTSTLYDTPSNLFNWPSIYWQWTVVLDANSPGPIIDGFQGRRPSAANTPGKPNPPTLEFFGPQNENQFSTQLRSQSLPVEVFDFRKQLLSGESGLTTSDFDATNVSLEQHLFNYRVGFELAYDRQNYSDHFFSPFGIERTNPVFVDVNSHLPDGRVNPNFGRPYMVAWESGPQTGLSERESTRATAYAVFDAREHFAGLLGKILGRHTLTGLLSEQKLYSEELGYRLGWVGGSSALDLNESNIVNQRRLAATMVYVGPSVAGVPWDQVKLDFNMNPQFPKDGDSYNVVHWDRATGSWKNSSFTLREAVSSAFKKREKINSEAVVLQSSWLQDHLITIVGWRQDESKQSTTTTLPTIPTGDLQGSIDVENMILTPSTPVSGDIFSYSVVAKQPSMLKLPLAARFSVHYSKSENFQPIAGQVNVFGREISPPAGQTEEVGFSVSMLDDRVHFRANWFETDIVNSRAGTGIGPGQFSQYLNVDFQTLQFWYEGLNAGFPGVTMANIAQLEQSIPESIRTLVDYRTVTLPDGTLQPQYNYPLNAMADVTNFKSKGQEYEVTANLTPNWRLTANVARIEAFRSATVPFLAEWVNQRLVTWAGPLGTIPRNPVGGGESFLQSANRFAINPILNVRAQDGVASMNMRKWRFNLVSNYTFDRHSRLRGFGVGGAYRWQDRMVLDYPQVQGDDGILRPDLASPFMGPSDSAVDAWVSYRRKIYHNRVDWKIQLNVRNVFADNELIPVRLNNDGSYASFRASAPRSWFVTSSFEF